MDNNYPDPSDYADFYDPECYLARHAEPDPDRLYDQWRELRDMDRQRAEEKMDVAQERMGHAVRNGTA